MRYTKYAVVRTNNRDNTFSAQTSANVIVHAYRRAAYTFESTNAEAPIWPACKLPTEYPIGFFRITDDSIYLLRTIASPKGVLGQRPHLWAVVAPTLSSMGVRCSVVLLGVCGSVVLFL